MRILQVHNSYQQLGSGEDVVVAHERELLQRNGHEVCVFTADNHDISSLRDQVLTALNVSWSQKFYNSVLQTIANFQPNVVHVHNFFPLITPSVFDACHHVGVPVVMTLHNYRLICAAATLLRDGKVCELCITGSPYWGARYRCYRGSALGSVAVAHMIRTHQRASTWHYKVNSLIALTDFHKSKLVSAGLPADKIIIKPNFLTDLKVAQFPTRYGALFVGRLSPEKGLRTLIEAWHKIEYPLTIIGSGPLAEEVYRTAPSGVKIFEHVDRHTMVSYMQQSAFLVMPSIWYEGLPMTLIEAFRCDLPVIASRIGSLEELIKEGVTGIKFSPGDSQSLRQAVQQIIEYPLPINSCRQKYLELYTEEENLVQLENIYNGVLPQVSESRQNVHAPAQQG